MQAFYAGKVIEIRGNLPACVKDMIPVEKYSSFIDIDKVIPYTSLNSSIVPISSEV